MLRFQRDRDDLVRVCHAFERAESRRAVGRMAAHRAERFRVLQHVDSRQPNLRRWSALRDGRDFLGASKLDQLAQHGCRRARIGGFDRQARKAANRFSAHVLVGIGPADLAEHGGVVNS
jgi:hypothetical protein